MDQKERIRLAVAHFEATYKKYKQDLLNRAFNVVKDRELAKDIVQSAIEKALKKIRSGQYQQKGSMIPWLRMITHNQSLDELRKRNKQAKVSFDTVSITDKGLNAEDRLSSKELKDDLWHFVRMLPKEQFEVIMMRYPKNGNPPTKVAKIAKIFGVSINTVTGRTRYALSNLRKLLKKGNVDLSNYKPENKSLHLERSKAVKDSGAE